MGNIWTQNADASWSLSPIPSGSTFSTVTNTWTDPNGNVWSQNPDGTWSPGTPELRGHAFPIGSRVNLNVPEGVFPATVTRHEGHSAAGEPLYGLTLDLNNINASGIPESLLTAGAAQPVPPLPPTGGEFRNVSLVFSASEVLANQTGLVRLTITGEYKGPSTSVQARISADDPVSQSAVSVEAFLPDTGDFFPFGPIVTGNVTWPAFTLESGSQLSMVGLLVETDGMGTALSIANSFRFLLDITGSLVCSLENNRAEILVQDDTGTHPLVQVGEQDQAEIATRSTPFVLTWPVRNLGTGPQSVRLEVLCRRTILVGGRFPRFSILETIVGPSFLVASGQQDLLSMTVSLADFPNCDTAGDYIFQMVGSDPACGAFVGERVIFKVVFSAPALSSALLAGFP